MRIGLVLNILDEEYQISVLRGIKKKILENGMELVCVQQENSNLTTGSFLEHFPKSQLFNLDGVILLTSVVADNVEIINEKDVRRVLGKIPVVSIGQKIQKIPSVLVTTDDSLKQLVSHLVLDHGYKNFVYISGSPNHQDAIIREKKFISIINDYKEKIPELNYTVKKGLFTENSAISIMKEYYDSPDFKNPDCIVCANDNMAIGVYKFFKIHKSDERVKKCAVTGFDNIPQSQFLLPPLTTISQPLEELGEKAMDLMLCILKGQKADEVSYLPSNFIQRASCGCDKIPYRLYDNALYERMQTDYVRSEQLLKMVSHIGQSLNYVNSLEGLKAVLNINIEQLEIQNFCVLEFEDYKMNSNAIETQLVKPVYVRRNNVYFQEFNSNQKMTIGGFFNKYMDYDDNRPSVMVIKFLFIEDDVIGCVLYESETNMHPYVCSISISIAQTLSRIAANEEREKHSEYLEKEVEKRTRELIEANNKRMQVEAEVLKISEIERQRFSNDLHDDICQRLAGISMLCKSYSKQNEAVSKEEMEELAELIGDTLQTTRQYAHNSYPVELESLGMNQSISNLCASFEKQSGISCQYDWNVTCQLSLDKTEKLNIFRIIQEALHNVIKHAQASQVKVSIKNVRKILYVRISDNGCGLKKIKNDFDNGLGLNSMQYRANQIDANFKIKQNRPTGTTVEIQLAIAGAEN